MVAYNEDAYELQCLDWLQGIGWKLAKGPEIAHDGMMPERSSHKDILLVGRVEDAISRIDAVCAQLGTDSKIGPLLIEVPSVTGVDDLGAENVEVRVAGRSLPVQQWKVERELRRRIAAELREMYIEFKVTERVNEAGETR